MEELKEAVKDFLEHEQIVRTGRMPTGEKVEINGEMEQMIRPQMVAKIGELAIKALR